MSLKNVKRAIISGNTYPNKDAIRALGGEFDTATKCWVINVASHPMNTIKQRAKLEERINQLGEVGCRIRWETA